MIASAPGVAPPQERHITLLVAGLFSGGDGEGTDTSVPARVRRLLARADRIPQTITGLEERLFALFGVAAESGRDLPVAAVTCVADLDVIDGDWWVRADPVYLEPRRDHLVLHACPELDAAEAGQLVTELNTFLAQDGWQLRATHPQRWYLKPPAAAEIATTAIGAAIGRDIYPLLPRGPDQRRWRTRLNELQILLHNAPVNAARIAQGRLPANSVWFWGSGRLPELGPGPVCWTTVWADDPLSLGLARLAGHPARPLPPETGQGLRTACQGNDLVVLGDPANVTDTRHLRINDWLMPLAESVDRGELDSLTVLADAGPKFHYRRRHRLRVWRRARPLSAWRGAA